MRTISAPAWGAEAVKELLAELDLDKLSEELKTDLETAAGQKRVKLLKRLEVSRRSARATTGPSG